MKKFTLLQRYTILWKGVYNFHVEKVYVFEVSLRNLNQDQSTKCFVKIGQLYHQELFAVSKRTVIKNYFPCFFCKLLFTGNSFLLVTVVGNSNNNKLRKLFGHYSKIWKSRCEMKKCRKVCAIFICFCHFASVSKRHASSLRNNFNLDVLVALDCQAFN